jgi:putative copper export protein
MSRGERSSLRPILLPWVLGTVLVSVVVLVVVLLVGGGAPQPSPAGLPDAGRLTGWGLPLVRLLADLAGVTTVGLALVASRVVHVAPAAADEALPVAGQAAAVWSGLAAVQALLFMSEAQATPLLTSDLDALGSLVASLNESPEGQAMLVQAALAAGVVWFAGLSRPGGAAGATLVLAVAAFLPLGLMGHAAAGNRLLAFTTLALHVAAAALWVGGLAALAWAALRGRVPLATAVPRYSALALGCVVVVTLTGVLNAAERIGSLADLFGGAYGLIVVAKVVAVVVLVFFGRLHRQHTVERLRTWRRRRNIPQAAPVFIALAAVELVVMAATVALGVGLARTPPPTELGSEPTSSVARPQEPAGSSGAVTALSASRSTR